jgi:hypothetical protein
VSNTTYSRPFVLRLDERERDDLTRAVMRYIEATQAPPHLGVDVDVARLRRLRNLLDRL